MVFTSFGAAYAAGALVGIGFVLLQIPKFSDPSSVTDTYTIGLGLVALLFLVLYYGSLVPAVVFFSMWLHRVIRNMPALGSLDPRWSPAGAVGRCFIPIMNWFHPLYGTLDAWRGSEPGRRYLNRLDRRAVRPPWLIAGWWALWLGGGLVLTISNLLMSSKDAGTETSGALVGVAGFLLLTGAAVLAVLVVRDVTARQERKNQLIATGQLM